MELGKIQLSWSKKSTRLSLFLLDILEGQKPAPVESTHLLTGPDMHRPGSDTTCALLRNSFLGDSLVPVLKSKFLCLSLCLSDLYVVSLP